MPNVSLRQSNDGDTLPVMLIDDLLNAIEADPRTDYRLAIDSGVNRSILTRLQRDGKSPTIETIERLADALGYDVRLVKRWRKRKGR